MSILTEKRTWRREPSPTRAKKALTLAERDNVRRAVAYLKVRIGPAQLAEALGMSMEAFWKATGPRRPPSPRVAYIVARAAGVPLEDVLAGAWPPPGACPQCGRG